MTAAAAEAPAKEADGAAPGSDEPSETEEAEDADGGPDAPAAGDEGKWYDPRGLFKKPGWLKEEVPAQWEPEGE